MKTSEKRTAIMVWRFATAPEWMKKLSEHGGDEDWVALVPDSLGKDMPSWAQTGTEFGCCEVSAHKVDGATVLIGAHA